MKPWNGFATENVFVENLVFMALDLMGGGRQTGVAICATPVFNILCFHLEALRAFNLILSK